MSKLWVSLYYLCFIIYQTIVTIDILLYCEHYANEVITINWFGLSVIHIVEILIDSNTLFSHTHLAYIFVTNLNGKSPNNIKYEYTKRWKKKKPKNQKPPLHSLNSNLNSINHSHTIDKQKIVLINTVRVNSNL